MIEEGKKQKCTGKHIIKYTLYFGHWTERKQKKKVRFKEVEDSDDD